MVVSQNTQRNGCIVGTGCSFLLIEHNLLYINIKHTHSDSTDLCQSVNLAISRILKKKFLDPDGNHINVIIYSFSHISTIPVNFIIICSQLFELFC